MNANTAAIEAAQVNRDTLFVEDATIISIESFPGEQYVIGMTAPKTAAAAAPGSFVHIRCDDAIPMRRPLSIMRARTGQGRVDVLFKVVGDGLRALAGREVGDRVSIIGPIGRGFTPSSERPRTLLIGGGVGIPPMVFLAEQLKDDVADWMPLVLMGSEIPFPFEITDSALPAPWLEATVNGTMPLLEEWGVATRLASLADIGGSYRGYVTELAREWLKSLSPAELAEVEIFTCGPTPMLKAVAALAREFSLPCQVSLEEFMACAVGGCAGCTVLVQTEAGPAMKRVCVDGPVFEAAAVFPE